MLEFFLDGVIHRVAKTNKQKKELYLDRSLQVIWFFFFLFTHTELREGEFDVPEGRIIPPRLGDKEK